MSHTTMKINNRSDKTKELSMTSTIAEDGTGSQRLSPKWNMVRWFAVLPAAFLGSILGYFLIKLINWAVGLKLSTDSLVVEYINQHVASSISGMAFVLIGVQVAPSHRNTVAMTLAVLLSLFLIGAFIMDFGSVNWRPKYSYLSTVLGSGLACFLVVMDPKNFSKSWFQT